MPVSAAVAANRLVIADTASAGQAKTSTAGALGFLGVSREASSGGVNDTQAVPLDWVGIVKVVAGGAITTGAPIISDGAGAGVVFTPVVPGTSAKQICGYALEAVASGELFSMLISPQIGTV